MLKSIPGYWLDKNVHQKFIHIKREDLIFSIAPEITITSELKKEYQEDQQLNGHWITSTVPEVPITIKTDKTEGGSSEWKVKLINVSEEDYKNLPYIKSSWSKADQEGFFLGQQGYVLLTDNFGDLRNKDVSIICFGGIDILKANIIKRTITPSNAIEFYKQWEQCDPRWVLHEIEDPSNLFNRIEEIDEQKLKNYFDI